MSTITVGSTIQIEFTFEDSSGTLVTPASLDGRIYQYVSGSYSEVDTFTASEVSTGVYQYDWVANSQGKFKIELTATTPNVVYERYFLIGSVEADYTLESSYLITLIGELEPMFVDPEYIKTLYPEADLVEVAEIIFKKSIELEKKVGCLEEENVTPIQHDFVVAATMCELSRIYGLSNSGFGGFNGADSFVLGDLEVDKSSNSSGSYLNRTNPATASDWCELAVIYKNMLASANGTFRPVVAGSRSEDYVAPSRKIKDYN